MFDPVLKNPWVRFLAASACLAAAGLLVLALVPVLTPVLLAFLVAYALHPVVVACERRRVPRMATILLLLGAGVSGALLLPVVVLPEVISEADRLVRAAGSASTGEWADKALDALPLRE
ncbi:MAG TPA: AI-2E family transporter, partial [Candidatus Hydrogenedentes bacterium]|nr:AI-2E family transporter [Candidatus Hydrogenedentota bacterium]